MAAPFFASIQVFEAAKEVGFAPKNILDVGAAGGYWTMTAQKVFPEAKFMMIDAVKNKDAEALSREIGATYVEAVLSDMVKEVDWFDEPVIGTGNSYFKERTQFFKEIVPKKRTTNTLDRLVAEQFKDGRTFELCKLDVQGAELDILKGGSKVMSGCELISLELPLAGQYNEGAPTFAEYIAAVDKLGFTPVHDVELHDVGFAHFQIGFIFAKKQGLIIDEIQKQIETSPGKGGDDSDCVSLLDEV